MVYWNSAVMMLLLLVTTFGNALSLDTTMKAVCTILSREAWQTYTAITTTEFLQFPCDTASSPSTAMTFTVHESSNGTQRLDLASIYQFHREKDLNVLVMCSANCIIELLHQAHLAETDMVEQGQQVVSRWLVIPTSGSVGDIANTRVIIKTTQMIILKATRCHHSPWHKDLYSVIGTNDKRTLRALGSLRSMEWSTIKETIFPKEKYGLHNKSLTVAVLESPPFVFRREMNDSVIFSGVSIDLLNELSRRLNFSYTIVEPEDGEWGILIDGKWTGLIGQLVEKKADLVVAPITISRSRKEAVDFTVPYLYVDSGIVMRMPSAATFLTLISPFRYHVFMCLGIALVLTTTFLLLLEVATPQWPPNRPVDKLRRYGDTAFQIFGSLMYKGGNSIPSMASSRILLCAWLLFTVIIAAIYSGNLTAFMADGKQKLPFSTLAELAQQDTYKWGIDGGSNYVALFRDSNRSDYQAIWKGIQSNSDEEPDSDSVDIDEHLRGILEGRYAFIGEETYHETWQAKSCDIQFVKQQFYLQQFAVGLPKNSTNTKVFSNEVFHMYERGLPRYWYDRWKSKNQCGMQERGPHRFHLQDLQILSYVVGAGVVLAGCVLVAEIKAKYVIRGTEAHLTRYTGEDECSHLYGFFLIELS